MEEGGWWRRQDDGGGRMMEGVGWWRGPDDGEGQMMEEVRWWRGLDDGRDRMMEEADRMMEETGGWRRSNDGEWWRRPDDGRGRMMVEVSWWRRSDDEGERMMAEAEWWRRSNHGRGRMMEEAGWQSRPNDRGSPEGSMKGYKVAGWLSPVGRTLSCSSEDPGTVLIAGATETKITVLSSRNSAKWERQLTKQFQYGVALASVQQQIPESSVAVLSGKKFISGCFQFYTIIVHLSLCEECPLTQWQVADPGCCLRSWKLPAPKTPVQTCSSTVHLLPSLPTILKQDSRSP